MIVGVILARKGSKRLPRKNILPFAGVPLVEWTIMAAMKSRSLDKVIVSTDDPEVAKIAFRNKAICLPRPSELALDATTSYEALEHVINILALHQDIIVLLQPTSPMRDTSDINGCISLAQKSAGRVAVSVEEGKTEPNGAVYVATASWLAMGGNWDVPGWPAYEMPTERSQDIDTLEDFKAAESGL